MIKNDPMGIRSSRAKKEKPCGCDSCSGKTSRKVDASEHDPFAPAPSLSMWVKNGKIHVKEHHRPVLPDTPLWRAVGWFNRTMVNMVLLYFCVTVVYLLVKVALILVSKIS